MSLKKNKEILDNILKENLLGLNKKALVSRMLKNELAGQRVFYTFLKQNGYDINPKEMDKNQSDGIVGNALIECKLNENEGGGPKKAYQELFYAIPNRIKQKGESIPFYRLYVELETFLVEVYDCHVKLVKRFDWFDNVGEFKYFFEDKKQTFEYDLDDEEVDLVEVFQNIYKVFDVKEKIEAYQIIEKGVIGWFRPFDISRCNINKLILNNDRMNEKYVQKVQGAFFTPSRYVKISTKYVMEAIDRSKKEGYDDYVIIDTCAGVGNLESQFDESVYSHMILGTINEAEAFTANIRFNGLASVDVVDALSEKGVEHYKKRIEEYKRINNVNKLAVIFLENPPYADTGTDKNGGIGGGYSKSYVHTCMKKGGRDLIEQFVFKTYEFYDTFAYILYSSIKIWKTLDLINKEVLDAYLCNRKYFNAGESAIALISWGKEEKAVGSITFENDFGTDFIVNKCHNTISDLYKDDGKEDSVCKVEITGFSFKAVRLKSCIFDDGDYRSNHGSKFVNSQNLLNVLPLFCASRDEMSETGKDLNGNVDYRVIDTVYKCGDGGLEYAKDNKLLQDCLLYVMCTQKNSCSSNSKFWDWANKKVEDKENEIYKIYRRLVENTGLNGLKNIEKFNKEEQGKLWKYHELYPVVNELKQKLRVHFYINIRPKLIKYELLK